VARGNSVAGCSFIVLGALGGAILCGGLFCVAAEIAGEREDAAIKREIQERTAKGEQDAEIHVVMEHKTMPIAVALGFLMELGVASCCGALLGGFVVAVIVRVRTSPRGTSREPCVEVCDPQPGRVSNGNVEG
jgi:hypothetical protein